MPRLFVAIDLPSAVRERLSPLCSGLPGARWITPENYHLTLRFCGDIDLSTAESLAESLADIARPSFELRLAGLTAFGNAKPRAVVARVEPNRALSELQAQHERIAQRVGLAPESRKYTPHVTLARLRNARPRAVADYLATRGGFESESIPIDRFVLFSARDQVGGGPYVVENVYPLARPPAAAPAAAQINEEEPPPWSSN